MVYSRIFQKPETLFRNSGAELSMDTHLYQFIAYFVLTDETAWLSFTFYCKLTLIRGALLWVINCVRLNSPIVKLQTKTLSNSPISRDAIGLLNNQEAIQSQVWNNLFFMINPLKRGRNRHTPIETSIAMA